MARATIKDIAQITQLSQGTVHRALHGKKGVSEEVREKILKVAEELGYEPNYVASSLKRKPLNLLVALPELTERNKYFYERIWQGIRKAMVEYKDYNINFIEITYADDKNEHIEKFLEDFSDDIDGVLAQAELGKDHEFVLDSILEKRIPLSLVIDDLEDSNRLCFVGANYNMSGRLCMELLDTQIDDGSDILVFCGNRNTPSHKNTVIGMEQYILENNLTYKLIKIFDDEDKDEVVKFVENEVLNNKNLKAIFSVNARNTVFLCNLLKNIDYSNNIRVIGSDIFKESITYMQEGVLNNVLQKSPETQSYMAMKMLIDYIVKKELPRKKINFSNTEIVFKNNLQYYNED